MAILRNSSVISFDGDYRVSGPNWTPYHSKYYSTFSQASISHGGYKHLGSGDVGGPWFMNRTTYDILPIGESSSFCHGPIWSEYTVGFNGLSESLGSTNSESSAKAYGTKAISQVAPTNPSFSLSQSIGEVRQEGLPAVVGTNLLRDKARFLKGSGSEYLNIEFGWKPLISDLRKFARTVRDSHDIVEGYKADANHKIKRRLTSPPVYTQAHSQVGTCYFLPAGPVIGYWSGSGSTSDFCETRSWFSGAFRYHLPVGDDTMSKLSRYKSEAGKLLGLRLTPDTVWNLAPWSWAADWFANTGDIMTNISNFSTDGLVMEYGYSMQSAKWERSHSFQHTASLKTGRYRKTVESKRRVPASPYGFNITFDGLSNRQKAICAAIGITRVR